MTSAAILAANNDLVNTLESALAAYPSHIPVAVQQATRDAIAAYRSGDRDPEVILHLSTMFAAMNDNIARYRLMLGMQGLGGSFHSLAYELAQ